MNRSLVVVLAPAFLLACGPLTADELGEDGRGESAAALSLSPASAAQILAFVNYPGTDLALLDSKVGLDRRAASNLLTHRNGADAVSPSNDDTLFKTIAELDAVPYVADSA